MWIRLSEIPPHGVVVSSQTPLKQLGLVQEEWWAAGPLRVQLLVTRDERLIMVDGDVGVALQFHCSRCLKECSYPMQVPVHIALVPEGEEAAESRSQLHAADLEQLYYRDDGVETNDVVREQLLLAVPMRVVCRPECRGLCASCGRDLNEGACGCQESPAAPWVEQLKRWRPK